MTKRLFSALLSLVLFCGVCRGTDENAYVETWLQYVPSLGAVGLGLAGVKAENPFASRCVELGLAAVAEIALVNGILKPLVNEERPDGSAFNSFPSGHTATAFAGAELMRLEYGWGWGGAAYALSAGVGALRVYHQRHWWWDTVAGAGAGILSANVGRQLLNPTLRLFGLEAKAAFSPVVCPSEGVYCATLSLSF